MNSATNSHVLSQAAAVVDKIESFTGKGLVAGSVKKGMKDQNGATPRDFYRVPIENIRLIDGYNVRVPGPALDAHIRNLANMMKEVGYDPSKPMEGYISQGDDGQLYVNCTDGHCRYAAIQLANSEGAEITHATMIACKQDDAIDDLTASLITSNSGLPLADYEKALVVKRLIGYGWDHDKISKRTGLSKPHLANYIKMLSFPPEVRNLWFAGLASMNLILTTYKQHPTKAHDILVDLASKGAAASSSSGNDSQGETAGTAAEAPAKQTKVRLSQLPGRKLELAVKKAAPRMHTVIERLSSNDAVLKALPEDIRNDIESLIAEFKSKADDAGADASAGSATQRQGDNVVALQKAA